MNNIKRDIIKIAQSGNKAVVPMAGDASTRDYYRVRGRGKLIVDYRLDRAMLESFLEAHDLLESRNLPVPSVSEIHEKEGLLLIEDLGPETLYDCITGGEPTDPADYYRRAVRLILDIQDISVNDISPGSPVRSRALDYDRLLEELMFMKKHYIEGLLGLDLSVSREKALEEDFRDIARLCSEQETVLCHRDFHSKNLISRGKKLFIIDYQDMMPGPYTYDIASLLEDPYVKLDAGLVREMKEHYFRGRGEKIPKNRYDFHFKIMSIQRNLKAVGTFASQKILFGRNDYLKFIPTALKRVSSLLDDLPEDQSNLAETLKTLTKDSE